jgi:toxin ParE1/3/4
MPSRQSARQVKDPTSHAVRNTAARGARTRVNDDMRPASALFKSGVARDAVLRRIIDHASTATSSSSPGRARNDLRPGLRGLLVERYLVIHRVLEERGGIVAIVHGSRDVGALFPTEAT